MKKRVGSLSKLRSPRRRLQRQRRIALLRRKIGLLLTLPALLLASCSTTSTAPPPKVEQARIQKLPSDAKQQIDSEQLRKSVQSDLQRWQTLLSTPLSVGASAPVPTKP